MTPFGKSLLAGIVIIIALIVSFSVGWLPLPGSVFHPPAEQPTTATTTQPSTIIPGVEDITYTNHNLSFSITHPATASSSATNFEGYLPLTESPLASFVLPKSMFAGTNLSEAGVYLGASSSPLALTGCTVAATSSAEKAAGTATINDADFAAFTASDAGAGNFYDSKIYRRIENGWCVEVVEMLHSTNIANYTPGTVTAFDKAKFQGILEAIVHTYQSIPTGV